MLFQIYANACYAYIFSVLTFIGMNFDYVKCKIWHEIIHHNCECSILIYKLINTFSESSISIFMLWICMPILVLSNFVGSFIALIRSQPRIHVQKYAVVDWSRCITMFFQWYLFMFSLFAQIMLLFALNNIKKRSYLHTRTVLLQAIHACKYLLWIWIAVFGLVIFCFSIVDGAGILDEAENGRNSTCMDERNLKKQ